MNDQLKQRIQYLIEHGGLIDDPLADIRHRTRVAVWLSGASVALNVVLLLLR